MSDDPRDQRIAELEAQVADLTRRLEQALAWVEELERATARQAAPFRREPRRIVPPENRKRPGRKPGHEGFFRQVPEQIDQEIDLPMDCCPKCGGAVHDVTVVEQVIEEIEPVRPTVIKLKTRRGVCDCCGKVDTPHPLRQSLAGGCAKVQIGPRAVALATLLNKVCGLTMRKTLMVLKQLCGLGLTPGGLSQALDRTADKCQGDYDRLIEQLRDSPAVNVDETSWWVGASGHWLWCFTTPGQTLFHVGPRASRVVNEVLGEKFAGVLVSDCLASYNPVDCRKHKCFAHHHRAIASAKKTQTDHAYLNQWKMLLTVANELWHLRQDLPPPKYEADRQQLEAWKDRLLDQTVTDPGDVKIQNRLIKHREHLLRCLEDASVEPTNNRAERQLRPAVICRKLSCGNRTDRGKQTWEILASLGTTCLQRGDDFVTWLTQRLPLMAIAG